EHHADHLRALGNLNTREFLHCEQIRQVIGDSAEIVYPVSVGDIRMPGLSLSHLFGSAVMKTDVRNDVDDILTIQLKDQSQHAMGTRVLRADIEEHEVRLLTLSYHTPLFGLELQRGLLTIDFIVV